jgi:hypothetical protein
MRALDPKVFDAVYEQVKSLLPAPRDDHPLGCHRPRVSDRTCLWAMLVRLVTGASWVVVERLMHGAVSDTTLRARRDEWIDAGVFDQLLETMLAVYEAKIGLDPVDAMVDASVHKAPAGGREWARTQLTGASWAGSGRLPPTQTGSPSASPWAQRTAMTWC